MDAVDRKILAELQDNGRLTITELAERVSLSVSPCHRRLRDLEARGIVTGYRAVIDPQSVDLGFETLIFVTMREATRESIAAFEAAVVNEPHILDAQRLFGDPDYLLRVVAKDLTAFQELYDGSLSALPGVSRLTTTLVMKTVALDRPLPLPR